MLPHLDRLALVLVLEAEGLVLDQLRKNISTKKKWWRRRRKAISKERADTITINTSVLLVILVTLDDGTTPNTDLKPHPLQLYPVPGILVAGTRYLVCCIDLLSFVCLPQRAPLVPTRYLASQSSHLNNASSGESFFVFSLCSRRAIFSQLFALVGLFSTMYEHVVEHLQYCYSLTASTAQHSTAQHRTTQSPCTKPQSKYVPIRVRQRKQADGVGESQHMSSIYTAR